MFLSRQQDRISSSPCLRRRSGGMCESQSASHPERSFFDPARPIVTKTDLKGQITYANRAFIDISGFTETN